MAYFCLALKSKHLNSILFLLSLIVGACSGSSRNGENRSVAIEAYDSLLNTPADESYDSKYPIGFSHESHINLGCISCHDKASNNDQVNLNICTSCHTVDLDHSRLLDYNEKLDSICLRIMIESANYDRKR